MAATGNYVLFRTELFLDEQREEDIDQWLLGGDCAGWFYVRLLSIGSIRRSLEPVMEDWGWIFDVKVDQVEVRVLVWCYFPIKNCWLFSVQAPKGLLRRQPQEARERAEQQIKDAVERIMAADPRFVKHQWFAESPFDLIVKEP
jgi:hypothetical protein